MKRPRIVVTRSDLPGIGVEQLGEIADDQLVIAKVDRLTSRARRGQGIDLAHRKLALAQHLQHFLTDCAGGTHDCYIKRLAHDRTIERRKKRSSALKLGHHGITHRLRGYWL